MLLMSTHVLILVDVAEGRCAPQAGRIDRWIMYKEQRECLAYIR